MKIPSSSWKEHEGFIAFMTLLLSILLLMLLVRYFPDGNLNDLVTQSKIRIVDSTVTGLMTIMGMAAQALFKTNQADRDLAAAAKATAEKVPPVTGEAKAENDKLDENPTKSD
jgi:ABC-type tungstate transport system substrate-binding protein